MCSSDLGIDGALLHRFFHRIIGEEAARISLTEDKNLIHARMADYFERQPLYLGEDAYRSPNRRKLKEEPWQRVQAGQLEQAEALLTDFDFAMAKCEAGFFDDLLEDFLSLRKCALSKSGHISPALSEWAAFMQIGRAHV